MSAGEVSADTRVVTFVALQDSVVVRSVQFDLGRPPLNDPAMLSRALRRVLDSVAPAWLPRVRLKAASGRPLVLAEPRRQVSVIIPDDPLSPQLVEVINDDIAQHPQVEVSFVKVPR